ncbi:MAG: hypothetical protein PHO53_01340 [Actinomycetota bacterium]|nr:hypothetical protein [Actinomycetota bacterium]
MGRLKEFLIFRRKELCVVAKVFEILGTIVIVVFTILAIFLLPALSRFLKNLNLGLGQRAGNINALLGNSAKEVEGAEDQVKALKGATSSISLAMNKAVSLADKSLAFLESNAFQRGFPLVVCLGISTAILWRGVFSRKKKIKGDRSIPPSK